MQSLFDACASKMTHKECEEIAALPTPKTVTNSLFRAKHARHVFKNVYEGHLGTIADNCFVFRQDGEILIDRTLANIEKSDLKQGFRYNCAFGKKEQLAVIWQKLSDEDKAALRFDRSVIVQLYSILMAGRELSDCAYSSCFRESLALQWYATALSIYRSGSQRNKKTSLLWAWLAAAFAPEGQEKNLYDLLCTMQKERDFVYDGEDKNIYKFTLSRRPVLPDLENVKRCSQICGVQEFEDWLLEVVQES